MPKKVTSIPVTQFGDEHDGGISIERISIQDLRTFEGSEQSHRHDRHSFFLVEAGTIQMEIDFQKYSIKPQSIVYMHPNQVHRILKFNTITVTSLALNNENLNPEYLELLENITPVQPLVLDKETFSSISETASLCLKFSKWKNGKLYNSLLKDSCNALVALMISLYLEQAKSSDKLSRFELVSKTFRELLERNYTTAKRPADYAGKLNISTPYLNECVKNATGHPVSYHIQQRIILEAKRLLHHSDQSVKEIAAALGYDDYPYFLRLFSKVAGMTPSSFRTKNLD